MAQNTTTDQSIFASCIPAIRTNLATCGSLTLCDVNIPKPSELDALYRSSGDYRMMEALFQYQIEAKMCQAKQNSLFQFLMANKVNVSKKLTPEFVASGLYQIRPWIMMKKKGEIDNNYWYGTGGVVSDENGQADANGDYLFMAFTSPTNIPNDATWFNAGERVFIAGKTAGGSATQTAWRVISSAVANSAVEVLMVSENANSNLASARLTFPTVGLAVRGTANVSDFESFCKQPPGLRNDTREEVWVETTRDSFCSEELYDQWRDLVMANNPLYREFYDLPTVEYNKQAAEDFQRRWMNTIFYSKALENQALATYENLEQVDAVLFDWTFQAGTTPDAYLKVSAPRCVGRKANAVGIYEKLAKCERVHDAQGQKLNLPALFASLYKMQRIRQATGHPNPKIFDLFMPSPYAVAFQTAMMQYFKARGEGILQLNMELGRELNQGPLGFRWRTFRLDYPDIEIRILTNEFFDDELAMFQYIADAQGDQTWSNLGRRIWIVDWTTTYLGIAGTNRVVNESGNLKELAKVDPSYMCVMRVPTKKQTLTSTTYGVVVECPANNLIIENLSSDTPEPFDEAGDYDDNPAA